MAQPIVARDAYLNTYFRDNHGFQPESDLGGVIVYRRTIVGQGVERIVVKHVEYEDQDEEIAAEEATLLKLWGSEHIIQLLSVVRDQQHRGYKWREPRNRASQNPLPILPWKLHIDRQVYSDNLDFAFIVMEYLPRGSGFDLIMRCKDLGINNISEPVLWFFFLCLTRACVGLNYPPNVSDRDPPAVARETLPPAYGRRRSKITHDDLHLGNIMFGDYDPRDIQPPCHQVTPTLKMIDFGIVETNNSVHSAQYFNIFAIADVSSILFSQTAKQPLT
ncbi:hypothetical protein F4678DRAFT_363551 [Xylaria arbuscula]|nr:hypothetical protein F4678DRAFT_363551 [Xylaria arbuscula]